MKNRPTSKKNSRQKEVNEGSKSSKETEVKYRDEFVKKVLEADKRSDLELIEDTKAFFDRYRK